MFVWKTCIRIGETVRRKQMGEAVVRTENRSKSCNSSRDRFSSRAIFKSANMLPTPISNPSDGISGIIESILVLRAALQQ